MNKNKEQIAISKLSEIKAILETCPLDKVTPEMLYETIMEVLDREITPKAGNPTSGKNLGDDLDPTKHNPFIHLDVDGNEHKNSPLENHLNTMAHIITNLSKKQK